MPIQWAGNEAQDVWFCNLCPFVIVLIKLKPLEYCKSRVTCCYKMNKEAASGYFLYACGASFDWYEPEIELFKDPSRPTNYCLHEWTWSRIVFLGMQMGWFEV